MAQGSDKSVNVSFAVEGLQQELLPIEFNGREGISQLFAFEVLAACKSSALDFIQIVGKPAQITVVGRHGVRPIHGMISAAVQRETGHTYTVYQLTLVPDVWRLLYSTDCRIFQKQNIKSIIKTILDKQSIPHSFSSKGNKEPIKRDYCVQYRESDWGFISRLLEEEGYTYWFEHKDGKHTLKIGNDSAFFAEIGPSSTLPYHPPGGGEVAAEHLSSFHIGESVRSGSVTLCDFNFIKPTLQQRVDKSASRFAELELYDYPGLYQLPDVGKALAQVRLQEAQAQLRQAQAASDCPRLAAGSVFELSDHPRKDINKIKYLVTEIVHHTETQSDLHGGALDGRIAYDNRIVCIPRDVPFCPPRVTRKPVVQGVQTALVVGPKGEEIYTDEHGRVKVHFHWDREGKPDENASCWVRVSQAWAGQGWGAMCIPRIGQEVIVEFVEGDPDRPIITGRVYHGQNTPPYPLPAHKTRSTIKSDSTLGGGGSNEIRFEDKKGSEEVYIHAQKDQNEKVENDMSTGVGNDQSISVGNDRSRTVGHNETITVQNDRTETVNNNETVTVVGNRSETIKQNERLTVVGNRNKKVVGTQDETISKTNTLSVMLASTENVGLAKSLSIGAAYTVQVGATMALTVGRNLARTVVGALTESVGKNKNVSVGQKHTINVGDKLSLVCGASKLVMDKSGKILLQGKDLTVKSSGPIKVTGKAMRVKGSSFNLKTSGVIRLKGSKIKEN